MDLLREVPPQVRIGFVGVSHSGKSRAIRLCGSLIEFILSFYGLRLIPNLPHIQVVGGQGSSWQVFLALLPPAKR